MASGGNLRRGYCSAEHLVIRAKREATEFIKNDSGEFIGYFAFYVIYRYTMLCGLSYIPIRLEIAYAWCVAMRVVGVLSCFCFFVCPIFI